MESKALVDGFSPSPDWERLALPVAVLPTGAFEQHGPHLPLLTDTVKVEYFARRLAEALGAALLPPLAITQSYEHSGFRGTLSLRPDTFMAVIRDVAAELEQQNFTRLVIVNGHGGNWALGPVVREINRSDRPIKVVLAPYYACDRSEAGAALHADGIHAGAWETSVMLALFPDLVGDYKAVAPTGFDSDAQQSDLNHVGIGVLRPNGVWGDPRRASAEAGRAIVASIEEHLLQMVRERLSWFDRFDAYGGDAAAVVRPMVESDLAAGLRLCRAAGWNQRWEDWAFFYRSHPAGCFTAQRHGKPVGMVTAMDYENRVGWVAMMLVDPALRRRGIGSRLLDAAIAALADCPCIKLDATPEGKKLYNTYGFVDEYPLARMAAEAAAQPPDESLPPVRAMHDEDMDAVASLDAAAFGVNRRGVIEGLRAMAPEYAFVVPDGDGVRGYGLGRHGHHAEHFGPIVAHDLGAAQALAAAALTAMAGQAVLVDVPHHTPAWLAWLRSRGFGEQRTYMRMYRGTNRWPGVQERVFAISGPELG